MGIYVAEVECIRDIIDGDIEEGKEKIVIAAESYADAANKIEEYYGQNLCMIEKFCTYEDLIMYDDIVEEC